LSNNKSALVESVCTALNAFQPICLFIRGLALAYLRGRLKTSRQIPAQI